MPARSRTALPSHLAAFIFLLALAFLLPAPPAAAQSAAAEPASADALADRVLEALGGEEAWDAARYFVFDFAERRHHWWDRFTGRHRLEGTTREEESYLVLHDVDDHGERGRAWIDGQPVAGERAAELVENAYAAWINDTYWLLAPYKLRDPGVTLALDGRETIGERTFDKLLLTFSGVGLTPGDRYWFYVDVASGEIDRWAYVLEGQEPPPTVWIWNDWESYGPGIRLSGRRVLEDGSRELSLSPITVPAALPDAVFDSPEPAPSVADLMDVAPDASWPTPETSATANDGR